MKTGFSRWPPEWFLWLAGTLSCHHGAGFLVRAAGQPENGQRSHRLPQRVPTPRHLLDYSRPGRPRPFEGCMKLGGTFLASLLLEIWSANGGMKAIIDALNVVYDEKEKRGFFQLNAVSLAFTVAGVAGILTAIGLVVAAPVVLSTLGLQSST